MKQKKDQEKPITAETRSLANQARIITLENNFNIFRSQLKSHITILIKKSSATEKQFNSLIKRLNQHRGG